MQVKPTKRVEFKEAPRSRLEPSPIIPLSMPDAFSWAGKILLLWAHHGPLFFLFFGFRFFAMCHLAVQDCDETYNYWEPAYHVLTGRAIGGKQTWEYAPQFALRGWSFVWLYSWPAALLKALGLVSGGSFDGVSTPADTLALYVVCKIAMILAASLLDALFVRAVQYRLAGSEYILGSIVSITALLFQLFSTGVSTASNSFLPSSFAMLCNGAAGGLWLLFDHKVHCLRRQSTLYLVLIILFAVAGPFLGWPFAALIVVPIGLDMLIRLPSHSIIILITTLVLLGGVILAFDLHYYKNLVLTPISLVLYNIAGGEGRGPTLYGVEPWYFFFLNLFLNFNVVFLLALLAPACVMLLPQPPFTPGDADAVVHEAARRRGLRARLQGGSAAQQHDRAEDDNELLPAPDPRVSPNEKGFLPLSKPRLLLYCAPFFIWFFFWILPPHKEERFMAPAYPFLILNALITARSIWHGLIPRLNRQGLVGKFISGCIQAVWFSMLFIFVCLSFSRLLALGVNYNAIQRAMADSRQSLGDAVQKSIQKEVNDYVVLRSSAPPKDALWERRRNRIRTRRPTICVGVEWYRFPSSMFLPHPVSINVTQLSQSSTEKAQLLPWRYCFVRTKSFSGALPLDFAPEYPSPRRPTRRGFIKGAAPTSRGAVGSVPNASNYQEDERTARMNDLNQPIPGQYLCDMPEALDANGTPLLGKELEALPANEAQAARRRAVLSACDAVIDSFDSDQDYETWSAFDGLISHSEYANILRERSPFADPMASLLSPLRLFSWVNDIFFLETKRVAQMNRAGVVPLAYALLDQSKPNHALRCGRVLNVPGFTLPPHRDDGVTGCSWRPVVVGVKR